MAIDYGREWQKLSKSTGHCTVVKDNTGTTLNVIMDDQIQETINKRELLMQEFVKSRMDTNIIETTKHVHTSEIIYRGIRVAVVNVGKDAFRDWLKNRKEVK